MTFQEWRTHHSGIKVEPMPDDPGVYMVSDRLLPGGPLHALRELSDYWVTAEMLQAHYGPTVWVAPREEAREQWTRTEYMDHRVSHERYYLGLAKVIGLERIERLILQYIANRETLAAAYQQDGSFNGIPLAKWDGLHGAIRPMLTSEHMKLSWCGMPLQPGSICWSLSESVCVAKAVARYIVIGTVG